MELVFVEFNNLANHHANYCNISCFLVINSRPKPTIYQIASLFMTNKRDVVKMTYQAVVNSYYSKHLSLKEALLKATKFFTLRECGLLS